MKKIYITGVSGVGKSTISIELNKMGIYSVDMDEHKFNLCHWEHINNGEISNWQPGIGLEWLESHKYILDVRKLKSLIDESKSDISCLVGLADNQDEFIGLFNKIILLDCSQEIFLNRIDIRDTNNFGKHRSEKDHILNQYKDWKKDILEKGAILINTDRSVDKVLAEILSEIDL